MSLAGVVLSGGRSARMGTPKALLDFRGQPFVVRILEVLEALDLKTRVLVLGPDAARIRAAVAAHDCLIVENPDVDGGPIASLRKALEALQPVRPAAILVWPVDLPHVRLATVERLIEAHERGRPKAVLPVFGDRRGHPVIWDEALFGELAESPAATEEGARAVLHAHGAEVSQIAVDDPAVIDYIKLIADNVLSIHTNIVGIS